MTLTLLMSNQIRELAKEKEALKQGEKKEAQPTCVCLKLALAS
jgi:hypothetical protein